MIEVRELPEEVMGHLGPLDHVHHDVFHVPQDAGAGEEVGALVHDGVIAMPPALVAHHRVVEDVWRRPDVFFEVFDRLHVPDRRPEVHVVAPMGGLEVLGTDAPVVLEDTVLERPERRTRVARFDPADIDFEPAQEIFVVRDVEVGHHVFVDGRLGLVIGRGAVGRPPGDGRQDSLAGCHRRHVRTLTLGSRGGFDGGFSTDSRPHRRAA